MENIENKVLNILVEICGTKKVTKDRDLNLIECGYLNSMGVVELLDDLEEEFDIDIPLDDFSLDRFDTINKVIEYVKSKL